MKNQNKPNNIPGILLALLVIQSLVLLDCKNYLNEDIETTIHNVTPAEANQLIQDNRNNKNFKIVDIRTPAEFGQGHIPKAVNIDFYSSDFKSQLEKLPRNHTYLVYCQSGNRSASSMDTFRDLKFKIIYQLLGGISRWIKEGYGITGTGGD
jgi:rhodanese-related sulfurtransferase